MLPTINMTETGKQIKSIMQSRGMNVKDVQVAFGFATPQAVYKWLQGKSLPTVDNLVALASLFGVLIDDIVVVEKENKWQNRKTSISA